MMEAARSQQARVWQSWSVSFGLGKVADTHIVGWKCSMGLCTGSYMYRLSLLSGMLDTSSVSVYGSFCLGKHTDTCIHTYNKLEIIQTICKNYLADYYGNIILITKVILLLLYYYGMKILVNHK